MPKSKHRRKGKTRPRAALPSGPTFDDPAFAALLADAESSGAFDDLADDHGDDPEMAEALARAEDELAAEISAAADADDLDSFVDPEDEEGFEAAMAPLLQAVEEQVRTNEPPAVAATLARLVAAGHARDEAIALIGAVLMIELNEVMRNEREFDPARYARGLAALPRLPELD
jgi:hypothetical protein